MSCLCGRIICVLLVCFILLVYYGRFCDLLLSFLFFFFKQDTAYELRFSDWSLDVCSSELRRRVDEIEGFVSEGEGGCQLIMKEVDAGKVLAVPCDGPRIGIGPRQPDAVRVAEVADHPTGATAEFEHRSKRAEIERAGVQHREDGPCVQKSRAEIRFRPCLNPQIVLMHQRFIHDQFGRRQRTLIPRRVAVSDFSLRSEEPTSEVPSLM